MIVVNAAEIKTMALLEIHCFFCYCLVLGMFVTAATAVRSGHKMSSAPFSRTSFPADFIFGAGSSALQTEGAANEDGRGPSIWDTYLHKYPERILDGSNADVAADFYHRFKEDIKLMKFEGLEGFKFSISWSRVLPNGKLSKGVNKKGIAFYNNLINELLANGIQPSVVLFHFDLPQALEDEYQGFLSPNIVDDFRDFAELCFKEFGDRIKHWITINEPYAYAYFGYVMGIFPPGIVANSTTNDHYMVGHHLLLAHANAVKLYREKYMASQKGLIGISLNSLWYVPHSNSKEDIDAAQIALDLDFGWFINTVTYGDYPVTMRKLEGNRLPTFTSEQAEIVKGSYDFLGINYYAAKYAQADTVMNNANSQVYKTSERNGKLTYMGPGTFVYPRGLQKLLVYVKENYKNPIIYVTENGVADANVTTIQHGLVNDLQRIDYIQSHLLALKDALQDGVNAKGYFVWAILDNFELLSGYTERYGINYVDRIDNLKRYPKCSALWLKNFLSSREISKFDSY